MKAGWQTKRLGELSELITDGTHNSPEYVEAGIPMLDSKHVKDGFVIDDTKPEKFISLATNELLSKRCKPCAGDILISSRGSIGKIAIVREGQNFNIMGNMILIRLPNTINRDFTAYYLHFMVSHIESIARGVAQKGLYLNQVRDYEVPLPPLPEQQRIVAILDEAFEGIATATANAKKNLNNAREVFESTLQSVFANRGEGWEKMELMEICEQITDGSHFSPKSSNEDEYPYITVRDIDDDIINFENCKFISKSNYHSLLKNGYKPHSGDLLFSKDGTVGKVSLVDFEKDFVVLSSLAIIRPKRKIIISSLLKYILKNPAFLQKAIGMKTGVAIRRIILKNLKLIEVSFPKSLPEQQTIVKKLDTLSAETKKLETIYQQKLVALKELKKSILNQAFSGQL